ncbi:hypothetical protein D030_3647A, partial [Vibrio parahaemolyticus AQ3810]
MIRTQVPVGHSPSKGW